MGNRKILFLITELDIGGTEKNLFRLATALRDRGWPVEVACLAGAGEVGAWLEAEGITVHYAGMDRKVSPSAFLRLVGILRRVKPAILHTFLFHANIAGRLANIFARVPAVVSSVRVAERRRPSHLRMDFLTQFLVDREICVSQGVSDFTRDHAHIRAKKLVVIPNAVEPPCPSRSRQDVRSQLGASRDDVLVLSVGRLERQKGYIYLAGAAALLAKTHPEAMFVIAGEGGERERIEEAVRKAGITERFRLLGWRADVWDLCAAADIFVLPSLWEGMANALLEAAAAGLAVVATSVEGSREVVDAGRTGLLVPPADPSALADAIGRLVEDGALRRRLGRDGASAVLKAHDPAGFVSAHEAVYRELL